MVLEGGPVEYMPVLEAVWQDLVHRKIYITGGCGALYDGVSPYGSWEHDDIQRVHQAYGRAYELPNVTAYNETCASIGGYLWNWRMFLLTGESRFIDLMERILYNGALAGISLDGRRYFYSNTLRRYRRLPFGLKWSRQREEYISSFCCPPNLARTLAETRAYAYAVSRDRETPGISVLLYGSSRATLEIPGGAGIELAQRTDYPWDGRIALEMESLDGPSRFGLSLRIPEWVGKFECRINGRPVSSSVSGNGFLTLHRNWQAGDRIDLDLPLDVALMESHPMVEETRNHLCVVRGPLVYCLESADLPAGLPMDRIGISRSTTLHPERETIGDQSMTVLRGDLPVASPVNNRGESDRLYHPATVGDTSLQSLRFIPYFAWDNRGFGEMTVWLPVR